MDKIAVVILNWNGCEMLRSFLPSVVRFSEADGAVVYVADNGSTDASVEVLCREFPTVRLILLEENQGFADGYNKALLEVDAEYVVLLNSDVEVTEHWLQPLADYMEAHPEAAACQPKIRSWRQKGKFEYAGAAGGFLDRYGYPFCRGRIMGVVEEDKGQYDTIIPVFWATGAALFIRLKDYCEAGGLDGRFFAHMEEIDLCPESFVCTVVIKRGFQILIIVGVYSDDSGTSFGYCYLPKIRMGNGRNLVRVVIIFVADVVFQREV